MPIVPKGHKFPPPTVIRLQGFSKILMPVDGDEFDEAFICDSQGVYTRDIDVEKDCLNVNGDIYIAPRESEFVAFVRYDLSRTEMFIMHPHR